MTVAENLFLSCQADMMGIFTNNRRRRREAKQLLRSLGSSLHPDTLVRYLSASDRYLVAIAQAISRKPKILIMDEPSDYLPHQDRVRLFDLVRDCRSQGIGIVYITHRLKEIANLCDRITILRDGKHVITRSVEGLSEKQTAALMLGREIGNLFPPDPRAVRQGTAARREADQVAGAAGYHLRVAPGRDRWRSGDGGSREDGARRHVVRPNAHGPWRDIPRREADRSRRSP
ncbi:ATP-binding cassette domain-containing protein [Cohnella rhizosphaerae]|uniref:ATP-binding cassette domain-containing protein n=1 Tax=Cohnella rhizosphaerae TaxID=1457232 RepID=A0A9X4KNB7_9BACL|nr:ATP-binding cassette domain-containing protein [Cohnella rhizosphaerae]MDG0808191.1 ATP-binding cassette domain-containing protein [Cohnella rhizosphaerae]